MENSCQFEAKFLLAPSICLSWPSRARLGFWKHGPWIVPTFLGQSKWTTQLCLRPLALVQCLCPTDAQIITLTSANYVPIHLDVTIVLAEPWLRLAEHPHLPSQHAPSLRLGKALTTYCLADLCRMLIIHCPSLAHWDSCPALDFSHVPSPC